MYTFKKKLFIQCTLVRCMNFCRTIIRLIYAISSKEYKVNMLKVTVEIIKLDETFSVNAMLLILIIYDSGLVV